MTLHKVISQKYVDLLIHLFTCRREMTSVFNLPHGRCFLTKYFLIKQNTYYLTRIFRKMVYSVDRNLILHQQRRKTSHLSRQVSSNHYFLYKFIYFFNDVAHSAAPISLNFIKIQLTCIRI